MDVANIDQQAYTACAGVPAALYPYRLATGWTATKVAGGLTRPRDLVIDAKGRILLIQSGKGLTQHDVDTNGCITASRTLVGSTSLNHGIYLSPDGLTLYASSSTTVYSWVYQPTTGSISASPKVVVSGMNTAGHVTRTLIIPANRPNLLVVSHGSNGNLDTQSFSPAVGRAVVKVFDLSKLPTGGYNFVSGGYLAGFGLRNEVALAFDGNNL